MQIWTSNIDSDSFTKTNNDEASPINVKEYSDFKVSPNIFMTAEEGNRGTSVVMMTPNNDKPVLMVLDQRNPFETPNSSSHIVNETK